MGLSLAPDDVQLGAWTYAPRVRWVARASTGMLLLPALLPTTSRSA
jgi:hypothetical protein